MRGDYAGASPGCQRPRRSIPTCVGTTLRVLLGHVGPRSIPTCVGTTAILRAPRPSASVHPHMRGDYGQVVGELQPQARSIPTCVGTTERLPGWAGSIPVHSHMRGDYDGVREPTHELSGPFPHAWGLRLVLALQDCTPRSIPTCVGTTLDQDGKNTLSLPVMCLSGRWCR